jgi:putative thiamine transport system permease protein
MAALGVWSFAERWRFPDALPTSWTLRTLERAGGAVGDPLLTTLIAAAAATLIALALVIGCLEHEVVRRIRITRRALTVIYLPLLVPQIGFLFGVQVVFLKTGLDGTWPALIAAHLLFVTPYVFLSLSAPYRALDPRYVQTALCLGRSRAFAFVAIKLPMLLRPILAAAAVGFAVSVGQYLPTIFAGAGRLTTLTTEAIALASGADQRVAAVYAFIQAVLPMCGFTLALLVPRWLYRRRRGMAVA